MPTLRSLFAAIGIVLTIGACATLRPDFEKPAVTVRSIRLLPDQGIAPRFEIGLHIVNPNRFPLNLEGIAYTLRLEGYTILNGAANDLPVIAGYGQDDVTLIATTDLLSSIRFFSDLIDRRREVFTYELDVKLDLGGFVPRLHVTESGSIDLTGQHR